MELDCPLCHAPLDVKGSSAHCAQCERVFTLEARCPECHQPLEVLKACGAVDYFASMGMALSRKNGWNLFRWFSGRRLSGPRFFHRRDLLHFAFDPAVFQAGGEQIAGFDLFCLLQHRTVAHRGDAVAPRQGG